MFKTTLLFFATALCEIIGCFLPWLWLKRGASALLLIPAAARACAGLAVLGLRPMDTSQYAAMGASRGGYLAALAVLLVLAAGLPLWLWGSFAPLAAAVGYGLAVWYGYRNLDGMSGDISGFALTLGELCGCAAAILWR